MTQIANRERDVVQAFELDAIKSQLHALLENDPRKVESFKTRILTMSMDRGLVDCTPQSIINCGLQALTLDLPMQAGQGYVVKYGGDAQFDIGYKGWQILAMRAGFSVLSDVVYSCDKFSQTGFGHEREIAFVPDHAQRKGSDDKWAKANIVGVIVSVRDVDTKETTVEFVDAAMIQKVAGKSPGGNSKFSPHQNWAEQMFKAKAIKQVLSKYPIDLAASALGSAIDIVNQTENTAQSAAPAQQARTYTDERFGELYGKWAKLVSSGKKSAAAIISQITNAYQLTSEQMERLLTLQQVVPDAVDTETGEVTQTPDDAEYFAGVDAQERK